MSNIPDEAIEKIANYMLRMQELAKELKEEVTVEMLKEKLKEEFPDNTEEEWEEMVSHIKIEKDMLSRKEKQE